MKHNKMAITYMQLLEITQCGNFKKFSPTNFQQKFRQSIFDHEIILSRGHSINSVNPKETISHSNHFGIQKIWNPIILESNHFESNHFGIQSFCNQKSFCTISILVVKDLISLSLVFVKRLFYVFTCQKIFREKRRKIFSKLL